MNAKKKSRAVRPAAQPFLQDKLAQAAWHEALIRITSGLIHDANNCLAGIVSLSEHCREVAAQQQSFQEELALINQAGHKAGEILKSFVLLNPVKPEDPTYYDLNALTEECLHLLRRVLKRKLELEVQLAPGPLAVFGEALELKKAIICITFNLADAIGEHGKITFQTSLPTDPVPARVYQGIWPKGPTVCLSLSSTAQECSSMKWEDLFDAALTGDEVTDLFRLRFCLVKQVLGKAQGAISIDSVQGTGAVFQLFLPKASLE